MAGATKTLDIACYSFTNQAIAQAILDAFKRGVQMRIVFDQSQTHSTQATFHDQFEQAGIPIKLCAPPGGIMHDKYTVADAHLVENGSFNYTERAQNSNRENVQVHDDANLAAQYSSDFESVWGSSQLEVSVAERPAERNRRLALAGPNIF